MKTITQNLNVVIFCLSPEVLINNQSGKENQLLKKHRKRKRHE